MKDLRQNTGLEWPDLFVGFLLVGYLCMSRSFAHYGVGPVYIGEIALAAFLVLRPPMIVLPFFQALTRPTPYSAVAWTLTAFLALGLAQSVRGVIFNEFPKIALQNLAFQIYPLFLFAGLYVGRRHTNYLRQIIRTLAWIHGFYAAAYVMVFSPMGVAEGGYQVAEESVALVGQPYGAAVVMLGLLSFERNLIAVWLPLAMNVFAFLAMQVRAAWLGFAACLPVWAVLAGRMRQLAALAAVLTTLLAGGLIFDLRIPAPTTRGGEISTRAIVARAVSAVDPQLADRLARHSGDYGDTVTWRTEWWNALWKEVHSTPGRGLMGLGYGYPIWYLHPQGLDDEPLRTPHNVLMYALSYTGWSGLAVFFVAQCALGALMWRVFRQTGQAFGLAYWVMIMVWSCFDNFLEAPFGAIPFYLLLGLAAAPLSAVDAQPSESASVDQPSSHARVS
jgi:hypothetical protein